MNRRHCLIALFCVWLGVLQAQTGDATLSGTVTDASGAVIPGASITVKNERTGTARSVHADEQGQYIVTNLAAAPYRVTGRAPDLGPNEYTGVQLAAGQQRTLNLILQPASVTQEVTVSGGELVVIDTSSARMGVNVGQRELASLPLNGRQVSQLYLMAPGALTTGGGSYDNIRFSGRANQQNVIRYDGIEASAIIDASPGNLNGESSSSFRLQSSLENIQEFRVESNNYPAEFGTGSGGQISVVTKSGSNEFHGALFEYVRNSAFDARNFFDRGEASALRLNQFGGSLGGPVRRDKIFFFTAVEALRQRAGINLVEAVPSASARARAVPSIAPLLNAYPKGLEATADPNLDLAFLNRSATVNEFYASMRLDCRLSEKYNLSARYFRDQGESFEPLGVTGNGQRFTAVPQNAMVGLQQILSPTILNETKVGLNAYKTRSFGVAPSIPGVDMGAVSVNLAGSVALPGIGGQGSSAGLATAGGLIRSSSAFNGRAQPYTNYTVSILNSLSWIRGSHNFKFGGEIRPIRMYTDRLGGTTYSFSNLDDFLANRPLQIQFTGDLSAPSPFHTGATGERVARQTYYIGYAQDEWKLRPSLTMNYGFRWEYFSVLSEARNLNVQMDTVRGTIKPADSPFYESSLRNFGPRLAFSWAPERFNHSTVFRAGAGYYYGPGQTEDLIQPIESDRVVTTLAPGTVFPVIPAAVIAGYNPANANLRFQPRAYAPGYRVPERILTYTASVQQQLPGGSILTVAYVGSQGRNLFLRSVANLITGVDTNPVGGDAVITRQFGNRFAEVDYKTSGGNDSYNALQTSFSRRMSKGLTLGGQWTWAHSIGTSAGSNEARTAQNPFDFRAERGDNNFDVRHSMNLNSLYEIPFGAGKRFGNDTPLWNTLLGDWQIGGTWNARTGLPVEVLLQRNDVVYRDKRTGAFSNRPVVVNGVPVTTAVINTPGGGASRNVRRPDLVAGVNPYLRAEDKRVFLNPAALAMPMPGSYGNLARNALHGPGMAQFDLTLQKKFPVRERVNLEFRAEIYNLLNRANFANPSSMLANSLGMQANQIQPGEAFGAATAGGAFGLLNRTLERAVGLGTGRQTQLSLRLSF
ncbi:MAG: TonB-dependent receptor [Acidimicrobiia bacterium]|nr:TonB-dependent receptor [Acidimicrobiia bacterium]